MDIKYFVCLNLGVSFGPENCSLGVSMYNNESIEEFFYGNRVTNGICQTQPV
jgi:hypothetical protein